MEEHNDYIIIDPPKNKTQTIIAFIVILPLCFIDWIVEWMGFGKADNYIASFFITLVWIFGATGELIVYNRRYLFDKNGVIQVDFNKYKKSISWDDMKFVGWCRECTDLRYHPVGTAHNIFLFSKIAYAQFNKYHIIIHRIIESKNYISIIDKFIDDETYEKILEFSGGERDIP